MKDLPSIFHDAVAAAIKEEGVYPHQCIIRQGERFTLAAYDMPLVDVLTCIRNAIERDGADELVYGLDRFTKPGQGTSLQDAVAGGWWRRDLGWWVGVIEYQHEPRLVLPWNWRNDFWISAVAYELSHVFPCLVLNGLAVGSA